MFMVKKHRVVGRTQEIMKLQRIASMDRNKALLGPVQPDLSKERVSKKRMFEDKHNIVPSPYDQGDSSGPKDGNSQE